MLPYRTTNRDGYQEYKSNGERCATCSSLSRCTLSKDHVKLVTRHIWEDYMDICDDIRHTLGMKVGLTFACMNLKKLAKIKARMGWLIPVSA